MRSFSDLVEVESCLETLIHWEPRPLAIKLARQPGMKEPRYMHLLSGEVEPSSVKYTDRPSSLEEQVHALRQEVAELREEFSRFRQRFEN